MKRFGWGLLLLIIGFAFAYFISGKSQSVRVSSIDSNLQTQGHENHNSAAPESQSQGEPPVVSKLPASTNIAQESEEEGFHGRRLDNIPEVKSRGVAPKNIDKRVLRSYRAFQGTSWKLWVGTRARLQGEQLHANAIASVNGYDVFPSSNAKNAEILSEDDHPVVYDESSKLAGVISGVYILELADDVNLDDLSLENDFQIIGHFSRSVLLKPLHIPFNFVEVFEVLSRDSNFKSVRMEVLGRDYAKF